MGGVGVMMSVNRRFWVICLLAFCSLAVGRDLGQDEALRLRQQGVILSLEQLVPKALGLHAGSKLLEVELEEDDGLFIYEIELLTIEGIVREVKINAANGDVLEDKVDD